MLTTRHVDHYAHASKVDRLVAERDVILTYVLKALSKGNDPLLTHLAFKGGTCIKKIYLGGTGRFSLDLDFTSKDLTPWQLQKHLKELLDDTVHYDLQFRVIDEYSRDEKSYGPLFPIPTPGIKPPLLILTTLLTTILTRKKTKNNTKQTKKT